MKRVIKLSIVASFAFLSAVSAICQDNGNADSTPFFGTVIGPRIGATYIAIEPDEFNDTLQKNFPDKDRRYYPLITQFGANLERRVRLGATNHAFLLQGVALIGGLEQGAFISSLSAILGFRTAKGFEFGFGPNVAPGYDNDKIDIDSTVVAAFGYTFSFGNVFVPMNLALVPPSGGNVMRISLLTGFNFERSSGW